MRICAVVVTYRPEAEEAADNIRRYAEDVEQVIVWENSSGEQNRLLRSLLSDLGDKILFAGNGENQGISFALNFALDYAAREGYTHLLTMDQDSRWENFSDYRRMVAEVDDGRTLYGPQIVIGTPNNSLPYSHSPEILITSGMLYDIRIGKDIDGYTPLFKVDGIDWDFCLRAREKDYDIASLNQAHLHQRFGSPRVVRFLGKDWTTQNYPPFRLHEILKSNAYLIRRFCPPGRIRRRLIKYLLIRTPLKILFFEENKREKLRAIRKGLMEGLRISVKGGNPKAIRWPERLR